MYLAYRYHSMSKVFIIVTICVFAIPAMFRYDVGTDYVLNPTSGYWEQRYLLPPHVEPKKENDHDESEQQ